MNHFLQMSNPFRKALSDVVLLKGAQGHRILTWVGWKVITNGVICCFVWRSSWEIHMLYFLKSVSQTDDYEHYRQLYCLDSNPFYSYSANS